MVIDSRCAVDEFKASDTDGDYFVVVLEFYVADALV